MSDVAQTKNVLTGCPFCGEAIDRRVRGISIDQSINCLWEVYCDCGARGPAAKEQELAICGWNRRLGRRFTSPLPSSTAHD